MRPLTIETLSVRGVRNLEAVDLAFGARFNVLYGENGQGKTNLLEAIYLVATSRSFRSSKLGEVIGHGHEIGSVRASVLEAEDRREQTVGLAKGRRAAKIDGKAPASLAEYATRTPIVAFFPGSVGLSQGGGAERRLLMDRVGLFLAASSWSDGEAYRQSVRSRQRVLEVRGPSAPELEDWERLMVQHGLGVMRARKDAVERLASVAIDAFRSIGSPGMSLDVTYERSAPDEEGAFLELLAHSRVKDRARGAASFGPHRDDVGLVLDGRAVRSFASQGQHRAIVLSLKLGEIAVVGAVRGVRPILLLDDVSSELDRARTAALFAFLRGTAGQVFLTTTRPELIDLGADREPESSRNFVVEAGQVRVERGAF